MTNQAALDYLPLMRPRVSVVQLLMLHNDVEGIRQIVGVGVTG